MDWGRPDLRQQVLEDLQGLARRERAVFLKIDPDIEVGRGVPGDSAARDVAEAQTIAAELMRWHWRFSSDQIQFRNTVLLNLALSEDAMLARMKQKARYNVRLGEKKGVIVRLGTHTDLASLYTLYAETAIRDGFVIRNEGYYRMVWEAFLGSPETPHQPSGELLIAQVDGETVAAIILFYFAQRAYYMYGMSREIHREKMPNHVLQWEAMKRARERGCLTYDLWGAPDVFNANDPMWGVFRFKEGLGGEVVRTIGAWDFPASSFWYPVYTRLVPRLLDIMRARGRQRTRQALAGV